MPAGQPLSSAYATAAIRLLAENVETATRNGKDKQARYSMALASTMAGIAFSNSMVGAVHAIGHALGGVCHVPHAVAMTILLPHVMRYNLSHCRAGYAELLPYLVGMDAAQSVPASERAEAAIEALEKLCRNLAAICGIPLTLKDAGVSPDSFAQVAQVAINDGALIVNPRTADENQVIEILKAAY